MRFSGLALLGLLVFVSAPAVAADTAFTLDLSGSAPIDQSGGLWLPTSATGTALPFGAVTVGMHFTYSSLTAVTVDFTFNLPNGENFQATMSGATTNLNPVMPLSGTITGGTGAYVTATGSVKAAFTITNFGVPTAVLNYTIKGSGTLSLGAGATDLPVEVSPNSLAFAGKADGPSSLKLFTFGTNIGGGDVSCRTATNDGKNWLSATSIAKITPASVQVTANPAGLAGGTTYQGTVTCTIPGANPKSASVGVTYVVQSSSPPQLVVNPSLMSFALAQGAAASTQAVVVTNPGSGSIPLTVAATTTAGGNWLSVSPASGIVTPNSPLTLAVTADPKVPPSAGTYSGKVTITGNGVEVEVGVTLSVSDSARSISLSQSGLTFYAGTGSGPKAQLIYVANAGSASSGSLNFNASAATKTKTGGNWLSVVPASGSVDQGGSGLLIAADPANLNPGDYYGTITVSGNAPNSPQTLSIVLHVGAAGTYQGLSIAPTGLVFLGSGTQTLTLSTDGQAIRAGFTPYSDSVAPFFSYSASVAGVVDVTLGHPYQLTVTATADSAFAMHAGGLMIYDGSTFVHVPVILTALTQSTPASPAGRGAAACAPIQLLPIATNFSDHFSVAAGWPTPLEVKVVDDCGNLFAAGTVVTSFSNGDPPLGLVQRADGRWTGTWTGRNPATDVVMTITATSKNQQLTGKSVFGGVVQVNPTPPVISSGGVLNGASFAGQVSPGSFVTLFGSKLAQAPLSAPSVPLPMVLSGAGVQIAGRDAPLFYSSDGQLNAIVPYGIPANTSQQVIVTRENALSTPEPVTISAAAPGIFAYGQNQGIIIGVASSGAQAFANSDNPVRAGDVIVIYCTGLGEVTPPVPAGTQTPAALFNTVATVTLTVGGISAPVSFAGLTPGQTGLYQVNAVIPSGIAPGDKVPVVLTAAGLSSAPVVISVR